MDIHGADVDKLSWSKLNGNLEPKEVLYDSRKLPRLRPWRGFFLYEFNRAGQIQRGGVVSLWDDSIYRFQKSLSSIANDSGDIIIHVSKYLNLPLFSF